MSCQSLYYAQVLSFLLWIPDRVGHLIWRLWGFWCPSIFLDFVTSGTFLPPYSFMSLPALKVSCLFSTMTICGSEKKKKYLLKRLLSKSVQAWSLSKSKAWVEAYNGLESLEEAAFFLLSFCAPRHLCDTCEHTALWQGANLNQFKTAFEMPFDMPLCLLEKEWKENLNCNICHIGCPPPPPRAAFVTRTMRYWSIQVHLGFEISIKKKKEEEEEGENV